VNNLPIAPLYPVVTGLFLQVFSLAQTVIALRIVQCLMSILVCYLVFDLGRILSRDERVGFVAATALVFSIPFIVEPGKILTETLYITLLVLGIWSYCKYIVEDIAQVKWYMPILVGILFGLATLTRAVSILFPLGIMAHALLISGKSTRKR